MEPQHLAGVLPICNASAAAPLLDEENSMFLSPGLLIAFIALIISVLWTNWRGAPWVPTPILMVHKMLKMAEVGPDDVVYDLGCGDGRMIIAAAWRYGARAVGIEIDPLRYIWCRLLIIILGLHDRVRVIYGDFFDQDLREASVVTCYLLSGTNLKLEGKFKQELRAGTRIVSNYFLFPQLHLVRKDDEDELYVYTIEI